MGNQTWPPLANYVRWLPQVRAIGLSEEDLQAVPVHPEPPSGEEFISLGEIPPGAVEEVNTRALRDQLGSKLEKLAGADFTAPMRERESEAAPPRTKPVRENRDRPRFQPRGKPEQEKREPEKPDRPKFQPRGRPDRPKSRRRERRR